MKTLSLALLFYTVLAGSVDVLASCPSYLSYSDLKIRIARQRRQDFRLFKISREAGRWQWTSLPLQFDPKSDLQRFVFYKPDVHWRKHSAEANDRLVVDANEFGGRYRRQLKRPCSGSDAGAARTKQSLRLPYSLPWSI